MCQWLVTGALNVRIESTIVKRVKVRPGAQSERARRSPGNDAGPDLANEMEVGAGGVIRRIESRLCVCEKHCVQARAGRRTSTPEVPEEFLDRHRQFSTKRPRNFKERGQEFRRMLGQFQGKHVAPRQDAQSFSWSPKVEGDDRQPSSERDVSTNDQVSGQIAGKNTRCGECFSMSTVEPIWRIASCYETPCL